MLDKLSTDMKIAMKAQDKQRLGAIRLIISGIKSAEIEAEMTGKPKLTAADHLAILGKMVKQRRDSIEQYRSGGRPELAAQEDAEIKVIEAYLPKQMSEDETRLAVKAAIASSGAASIKDMGKVMAALKADYTGQMDFGKVGGIVKDLLK